MEGILAILCAKANCTRQAMQGVALTQLYTIRDAFPAKLQG